MKLLVIGDLHGNRNWKNLVKEYKHDFVVFVGDYTDSYKTTIKEDMDNLMEIIEYKKANKGSVVLLLGNHDLQYVTKYNSYHICTRELDRAFPNLYPIYKENIHLFQLAWQVGNTLFTHAGVHKEWLDNYKKLKGVDAIDNYADSFNNDYVNWLKRCTAEHQSQSQRKPNVFYVGRSRTNGSFDCLVGGPVWFDNRHVYDFNGLPENLNQVAGHNRTTSGQVEVYTTSTGSSTYWCTDCLSSNPESTPLVLNVDPRSPRSKVYYKKENFDFEFF